MIKQKYLDGALGMLDYLIQNAKTREQHLDLLHHKTELLSDTLQSRTISNCYE